MHWPFNSTINLSSKITSKWYSELNVQQPNRTRIIEWMCVACCCVANMNYYILWRNLLVTACVFFADIFPHLYIFSRCICYFCKTVIHFCCFMNEIAWIAFKSSKRYRVVGKSTAQQSERGSLCTVPSNRSCAQITLSVFRRCISVYESYAHSIKHFNSLLFTRKVFIIAVVSRVTYCVCVCACALHTAVLLMFWSRFCTFVVEHSLCENCKRR